MDLGLFQIRGSDEACLTRIVELFENPSLLNPYTEQIIDDALWEIGDTNLRIMYSDSVDWILRCRVIRSFEPLFRELFATRCTPGLSHLSETGCPLNSACYMWWDFECWRIPRNPLTPEPLDLVILSSMQSILKIRHLACQESALHGLGHLHGAYPVTVEKIIDSFLRDENDVCSRLRDYACAARRGSVL